MPRTRSGFSNDEDDNETPTLVMCLACGGEFEKLSEVDTGYRMSLCEWCTQGSMTPAQLARWHAHTQGRNR